MTSSQTSPRPTTAAELRRAFLDFFQKNGHTVERSAPLVPNDPTLMFTTAGMVPFKPYYTAGDDVPYTRAVSIQKCLRLTDLDNVGLTPRHDTFFEMLGNFSFGPREKDAYFKEDAIRFAWEFTTQVLGMPKNRLFVSIFEGEGALPRDDDAATLWKKMGVASDHIVALGRKDNFWGPAGATGACGPSSEIYFDLGEKRPDYLHKDAFWGEKPGDAGDRFMEFWNLVFPQFDAQKDGSLKPLLRPGIDTGMGLERLAMIMQDKQSIFETDLFQRLVEDVRGRAGLISHGSKADERDRRIVADHARALTFAGAEGFFPGTGDRGSVLRRLLQRAVVHGRTTLGLGIKQFLLPHSSEMVVHMFKDAYPELERNWVSIRERLATEEEDLLETFEVGFESLNKLIESGAKIIPGTEAFVLHDTLGFPIEMTEDIARDRGLQVDREGFDRLMAEQRTRARSASKFGKVIETLVAGEFFEDSPGPDSRFVGYDSLRADAVTLRRWRAKGDEIELVLDQTPFYAESGGQVADRGWFEADGVAAELTHVYREGESIVHRARVTLGSRDALIAAGKAGGLVARVDPAHRAPTQRHHTATHLLHAALRRALGTHVRQAGSLVAPDRLRFDYTHFEAPSREQLERIEREVNEWVLANREVSWKVMPIAEAKAQGAMALFGEKYGAEVRMVTVEGVPEAGIEPSRELCGGTHVARTGDIGAFVVVSDGTIASGVRRIEALCGHEALRQARAERETLARAAAVLQANPAQLADQIEKLKAENAALKKAQAELQKGGLEAEMAKLAEGATVAPGGRWVVAQLDADADAGAVREAADALRGKLGRGAALLAVAGGGKLSFVAAVSDDLVAEKKLRADELVRAVAKITGGSGGGKPHLALAGGKDLEKLGEALSEARRLIQQALGS